MVTLAHDVDLVAHGLSGMLAGYDEIDYRPPADDVVRYADLVLVDPFGVSQEELDRLLTDVAVGRVVVYTWPAAFGLVQDLLDRGAIGCLSKAMESADLVAALLRIHNGEVVVDDGEGGGERAWVSFEEAALTAREAEVVGLIVRGHSNRQIADEVSLSINSVKSYIRTAYRKMGVTSRSQAVLWGLHNGLDAAENRASERTVSSAGAAAPAEPRRRR